MYIYNLFNYALFLLIYINFYWKQWEFSAFSITNIKKNFEAIMYNPNLIFYRYNHVYNCGSIWVFTFSVFIRALWVFILQFSNVYFSFINLI